MSATRVLLIGADGRMGQAIRAVAESGNQFVIAAIAEQGDSIEQMIADVDVAIDFSHASATAEICATCVRTKKPLVTGTTGHTPEQLQALNKSANEIALIAAPNFSIGVNTLFWLTRKAADLLGADFDVEVVEHHHRLKKDSPSGTAKRLAEILAEARQLTYENNVVHGREGLIGERPRNEIGMHAIRGGDVVGDHTVIFAGRGERLELTHKASNRETFAAGALRAAAWIIGKPPGRYTMEDVLGFTDRG